MLKKIRTSVANDFDKKDIKKKTEKLREKIITYQKQMLAEGKHSLLIIFQGLDASGKSGSVRNTLIGVSPMGIKVKSFKKPTPEEMSHDFLWRVHQHTPAKGMIQVFDRSHYEDILVPTVNGYIETKVLDKRYEIINNFEKLVESNGTTILKFYLHKSKDKQ